MVSAKEAPKIKGLIVNFVFFIAGALSTSLTTNMLAAQTPVPACRPVPQRPAVQSTAPVPACEPVPCEEQPSTALAMPSCPTCPTCPSAPASVTCPTCPACEVCKPTQCKPCPAQSGTAVATVDQPSVREGVSSLMKDFNCGFSVNGLPHFLLQKVDRQKIIVDVGLKDGQETMAAVKSGYIVYAFEPVAEFVADITKKMKMKKLDFHLVKLSETGELRSVLPEPKPGKGIAYIFQAAAGSEPSVKTIYVDGFSTSLTDPVAKGKGKPQKVQMVKISDYVQSDVFFFKVDAQGFDLEVLRGAEDLFRNQVVRLISVELWPKGLSHAGATIDELLEYLMIDLSYRCFDTRVGKGTQLGHVETYDGYLQYTNGLFDSTRNARTGFFDDLTCLSNRFHEYSG